MRVYKFNTSSHIGTSTQDCFPDEYIISTTSSHVGTRYQVLINILVFILMTASQSWCYWYPHIKKYWISLTSREKQSCILGTHIRRNILFPYGKKSQTLCAQMGGSFKYHVPIGEAVLGSMYLYGKQLLLMVPTWEGAVYVMKQHQKQSCLDTHMGKSTVYLVPSWEKVMGIM